MHFQSGKGLPNNTTWTGRVIQMDFLRCLLQVVCSLPDSQDCDTA